MPSLLNTGRPPVFCPGCSHERITRALDNAFQNMDLTGDQIVIVTDIGCSGLFDTFFHTHAFHGLHGRALTYAAGIKTARPELNVVVTMGDGGLGIGGAHILSACRRNLDITLLILNNFNFGMTGGQFSATTPTDATTIVFIQDSTASSPWTRSARLPRIRNGSEGHSNRKPALTPGCADRDVVASRRYIASLPSESLATLT